MPAHLSSTLTPIGVILQVRRCQLPNQNQNHRLGVQKRAKLEKGCVFGHIGQFWNGHDGQFKKNAYKNVYLGSIFIPEKYVFRVCFESLFNTRMISSLKYKWPPRGRCHNLRYEA